MKNVFLKFTAAVALLVLFQTSCKKDESATTFKTYQFESDVATAWFDRLYTLTKKTPGYTPPVAARSFGYAGLTLWESVVHGIPNGRSMVGQVTGLSGLPLPESGTNYYWPACANSAMLYIAKNLYPTAPADQLLALDSLAAAFETSFLEDADLETINASKAYGEEVAASIFVYSKDDGGHEGYAKNFPTSYTAPVGAGLWVPTSPANPRPLQPFWGQNRPFSPTSIVNSQPSAPLPYSENPYSLFYSQALEVYSVTTNLTVEQEKIAEYWSDDPGVPGTPPGHSISIANQLIKKDGLKLHKAAEIYCKLGMGVSDAFVSCWKCKFDHNLLRPITYINNIIDPTWTTLLSTPPFPEYTSGHSVQSGATAEILGHEFGYKRPFTDYTHANRTDIDGSPRSFSSFDAFAAEAAISRLYGGIHYRDAIDKGVVQGKIVGQSIENLQFSE